MHKGFVEGGSAIFEVEAHVDVMRTATITVHYYVKSSDDEATRFVFTPKQ